MRGLNGLKVLSELAFSILSEIGLKFLYIVSIVIEFVEVIYCTSIFFFN